MKFAACTLYFSTGFNFVRTLALSSLNIVLQQGKSHVYLVLHQISLPVIQLICRLVDLVYLKRLLAYYFCIKTMEPLWPGTEPLINK